MSFAQWIVSSLSLLALGGANAQVVVAGPDASLDASGSWSWQGGAQIAPFRAALVDPTRFGPGGVVPHSITTADLATVDATSLQGVDVFVSPYWADAATPPSAVNAVVQHFLSGGSLLLYQDGASHDAIGAALGVPTSPSNGSDSTGGAPLFDGPFGLAGPVQQGGTVGQLLAADVLAANGRPGAVNAAGEITAAVWDAGDYAPGAGRMVIVADVNMIAAAEASYAPLDDNGIFALNGVAFAVCGGSIEPYGAGCPGTGGLVPSLELSGCAEPGEVLQLEVSNALGGAPALLFVGLSAAALNVHGSCDLLVDLTPPSIVTAFALGGAGAGQGTFSASGSFPATVPSGSTFHLQAWIFDPGAGAAPFEKVAATAGVRMVTG